MRHLCTGDRPCGRVAAGRRGFTFVELIVGLAILTMIAAVVGPALTGSLDRARVRQGSEMLGALIASTNAFFAEVGDYPGRLSQLVYVIDTTQRNSCGNTYTNGRVSKWAGPYYRERTLVAGGALPVFVGNARDDIVRIATGPGNAALIGIVVDLVAVEDAEALDRQIDGGNGRTTGTIQWDAADAAAQVVLRYLIPVSGC